MSKLKSFAFRYPIIFSMIVMVIAAALTEIHVEDALAKYLNVSFQGASYLTGIIEQGAVSVLLVILLSQLGMVTEAGFTKPSQWKSVWLIWPIILYSLLNGGFDAIEGSLVIDWSRARLIILFVLLYMSVGFFEEILFRGVILRFMLRKWGSTRKGVYIAVIVSNLVFGVLHLINFMMGRRTLLSVGAQVFYGLFFGVFFAACFIRNKSIWSVIFAHALFDLCGGLNAIAVGGSFGEVNDLTLEGALTGVLITLPLFLYGLFILRKEKPEWQPAGLPAEQAVSNP